LPFTVNLTVDTLDTSRCFLIVPIRSTGAGLCNHDFRRESHCEVIFVSTRRPGERRDPSSENSRLGTAPDAFCHY
jgi:hypothetical protein